MNKYSKCLPVIPQLRHISDQSSVEVQLQKLQAQATNDPERHCQLAAIRYYLQDILWNCAEHWQRETHFVSNYSALLDTVRHFRKPGEKVCFVTFNYDTLLDQALRRAGYPSNDLPAYLAHDLMLVKLHGSVNWARRVNMHVERLSSSDGVSIARELIDQYSSLSISREFVLIGGSPPSPRDYQPLFPALAIPVETKLDFECPPEHIEALKAFIPEVTKILMIGWGGTEQPFLELLKRGLGYANPLVMVVSGSKENAEASALNLRRAQIPANFACLGGGFTDFIVEGAGMEFLSK